MAWDPELEQAVGQPPEMPPEAAPQTEEQARITLPNGSATPVTWTQLWLALGTTAISTAGTLWAIILRRKRPKAGAEDAVYEVNRATILDLRAQVEALQKENAALRTQRADFEGLLAIANANLRIAQQAADIAVRAARENDAALIALRARQLQSDGYIYTLHAALAKAGVPIPPEPALQSSHEAP